MVLPVLTQLKLLVLQIFGLCGLKYFPYFHHGKIMISMSWETLCDLATCPISPGLSLLPPTALLSVLFC